MSQRLILASGSASRRQLLENAGIKAIAIKPNVDEETAKTAMRAQALSIGEQAMQLAELKAVKISKNEMGLVIGGDQMLALGDQAFDKPKDLAGARSHLKALSGQTHILETAIVIAQEGEIIWRHLARPHLTMRVLSDEFITQYIDRLGDDLLSTVGGYKLESLGSQLFSKIEGD